MSAQLAWPEVAVRLALAVVAGFLIGLEREEHGRPAGLRTTMLVCLAAAVSMIQTNLLLPTHGKPTDSYAVLDLMRLPLGILTGMGFIGAGAILKRGNTVHGITTAATLWFVTVIGLCFGGGQLGLGIAGVAIGILILSGLKRLEAYFLEVHRATLVLSAAIDRLSETAVLAKIAESGLRPVSSALQLDRESGTWSLRCDVHWTARSRHAPRPAIVDELSHLPGIICLQWTPEALATIPLGGLEGGQ
jgi:putative Mg2+ transporter-C (MgtC) family protein